MHFTLEFLKIYYEHLVLVAPLLAFLAVIISALGLVVGRHESLSRFDAIYWAFITALTVGYGDIRPTKKISKALSVLIALTGFVFTGLIVALAVQSGIEAFALEP